ncbi:hypothetical protein, partial [Thalassovita mediterranea]|uniref:hypothetical protein n=1 Tax=Thalassovita mediterranea TaxID=340021 RepID=UPI003C722F68
QAAEAINGKRLWPSVGGGRLLQLGVVWSLFIAVIGCDPLWVAEFGDPHASVATYLRQGRDQL